MEQVHNIVFPKKTGAALEAAKPYVEECYVGYYGKGVKPLPGARPRATGKLLHLSCHRLPDDGLRQSRQVALLIMFLVWLFFYPVAVKLRTIILAVGYSFIEYTFTGVERQLNYTSVTQFCANLLYLPVLLDIYGWLIGDSLWLYVLLFPLNIWVLEVVQQAVIIRLFDSNVAWCYKDYSDDFFDGACRLGHGPCWIALGVVNWYVYPLVCLAVDKFLGAP
eukprot:TRINITY_DN81259_c0_g1_i1.p2 TRINITY_DN81259_c0_g1~~TRINITY_DN81259_c0_g1_i1.p2  ORF type:complete len:221 (+),score=40.02 TRINITY_DN81259_c0_g1_i1:56-718(+)